MNKFKLTFYFREGTAYSTEANAEDTLKALKTFKRNKQLIVNDKKTRYIINTKNVNILKVEELQK